MDLDDTPTNVNGPKNTVSKLMDLDDTSPKVNGPPVYFTLIYILTQSLVGAHALGHIAAHGRVAQEDSPYSSVWIHGVWGAGRGADHVLCARSVSFAFANGIQT